MNADFLAVLEFWEREKGISRDVLISAVQEALLSAAKKAVGPARELRVEIDPKNGDIRRSLAGDQRAYADLLHETARLLRPFLSRRLRFSNEVDDLLQEILLSIHKARHTYDGQRPYKPWAYAIARFRLLDHLRAHYADRLRHAEDYDELEEILPDDVTESAIRYESISAEVERLPAKHATILRLMHQDGYTAKEVAAKIGMNESAVKVAAHRAYKILRERLERS